MQFKFNLSILDKVAAPKIYMGLKEHNQELRERLFQLAIFLITLVGLCFSQTKFLAQFLQSAIDGIKFFQPSPDEYFFLSFKLSLSAAIFLESPFLIIYKLAAPARDVGTEPRRRETDRRVRTWLLRRSGCPADQAVLGSPYYASGEGENISWLLRHDLGAMD